MSTVRPWSRISRPTALTLATLCLIFNVYVFHDSRSLSPRVQRIATLDEMLLLRRPDQYWAYTDPPSAPSTPPIFQVPTLLERVDAARPHSSFGEENYTVVRAELTAPTQREVQVTDTMSTIAQFIVLDVDMNLCELHLDLASADVSQEIPFGMLDVWQLSSTPRLNPATVTYAQRPLREVKVAAWELSANGTEHSMQFECSTNNVLTFELAAAAGSRGHIRWSQDHQGVAPALTLKQHWTGVI